MTDNKVFHVDKSKVFCTEQGGGHTCFSCSCQAESNWRLVGYDEYGELWICQLCWDKLESNECPPQINKVEDRQPA